MRFVVLALSLTLAACGGPPSTQPPPPPPVLTPSFEADPAPQAPSLTATLDLDTRTGTVTARDLGAVFGVAFQLTTGANLVIDSTETTDAFGADAKVLNVNKGAFARFGFARPGPTSTPADLSAPQPLVRFTFHAVGAVDLRPALERVTVRRLDGSFVKVATATGRLVIP